MTTPTPQDTCLEALRIRKMIIDAYMDFGDDKTLFLARIEAAIKWVKEQS